MYGTSTVFSLELSQRLPSLLIRNLAPDIYCSLFLFPRASFAHQVSHRQIILIDTIFHVNLHRSVASIAGLFKPPYHHQGQLLLWPVEKICSQMPQRVDLGFLLIPWFYYIHASRWFNRLENCLRFPYDVSCGLVSYSDASNTGGPCLNLAFGCLIHHSSLSNFRSTGLFSSCA